MHPTAKLRSAFRRTQLIESGALGTINADGQPVAVKSASGLRPVMGRKARRRAMRRDEQVRAFTQRAMLVPTNDPDIQSMVGTDFEVEATVSTESPYVSHGAVRPAEPEPEAESKSVTFRDVTVVDGQGYEGSTRAGVRSLRTVTAIEGELAGDRPGRSVKVYYADTDGPIKSTSLEAFVRWVKAA